MRRIHLLAAALVAGSLSACLFEDDKTKFLDARFEGRLETLDSTVFDSAVQAGYRQWRVPVDTGDAQQLRGKCQYTGYIADSMALAADSVNAQYTNTLMGNRIKTASQLRLEGVRLYLDRSLVTPNFYTHYRVDVECEY